MDTIKTAPVSVKKYPDLLATVYVWDFEHRFYFVVRNKRTRKILGVSNDLFRDYNRSVEENANEIVDTLRRYCGEVVFGGWHPKKTINN